MNSSAGLAFAPHVITVGAEEVVIFFHFIRNLGFDLLNLFIYFIAIFF